MTTRKDMTEDEWHWLKRIYRYDAAFLTVAMAKRLSELGVTEQRLGGAGVSALGKKLVEIEILAAKKARKKR